MDFPALSLKTDQNYIEFPGLSSVMSSCLSKFDFPNHKNMPTHQNTKGTTNHFVQSVDIMHLIPTFHSEQSPRLCDLSKTVKASNNSKKFDSYSQFSTMNILSSLVGGFVGSKSQVGCTSMQGDRFQIWDLVWQKLIEIVDSEEHISNNFQSCDESVSQIIKDNHEMVKKKNEPIKQSYADVAKMLPNNSNNKNNKVNLVTKENAMKSNKQKRKQQVHLDCCYKGKLDFGRSEKKVSLQEMNSFSSSRWSNSRRKHFRKGVEKINKREEREAARDGLEFVNQELHRNKTCNKNMLVVNNNINCNKIKVKDYVDKETNCTEMSSPSIAEDSHNDEIEKEAEKHYNSHSSSNFNRKNSDNSCNNEVGCSAINTIVCEDDLRPRLGSICSVDSDDSFIIFDGSGNDDIISQFYFDLQANKDSDSSSSSSFSDFDDDSDASDSYFVVQTIYEKRPYKNESSCWHAHCDNRSVGLCVEGNKDCKKKKSQNIVKESSNAIKCKCKNNDCMWKHLYSKLKLPSTDMPYTGSSNIKSCKNPSNSDKRFFDMIDGETKHRSASECLLESEDGFVTFGLTDDEGDELSFCIKPSCNSICEFDDEDIDLDEINCAILTPYHADYTYDTESWLEAVNSEWESKFNNNIEKFVEKNSKKVHFPPDDKLVAVKKMVTWNYAFQAARIGPWEQLARDTMRFQNRIRCVSEVLESVLNSKHREKIWKERFSDLKTNYQSNDKPLK